jgi:CBS-domain-containing membrane protein
MDQRVAVQSRLAWIKDRPWTNAALAGFGGFLAIAALAYTRDVTAFPFIIPPFGATCVLAFGFPQSPFARSQNIIGGHLLAAIMGFVATSLCGFGVFGIAVGVGLAITVMMLTDTVHPPAGANPIVVALLHPGWSFLLVPVLAGATAIVIVAKLYIRLLRPL